MSTSFRRSDGTGMGSHEITELFLGNYIDLTEILREQSKSAVSGGEDRFFISAIPPCALILLNGFLFQIAGSQNRVYLTADNLVLNLQDEGFTR